MSADQRIYYPPPESQGGWRGLDSADEVRTVGNMDPDKLDLLAELHHLLHGGYPWAIAIIRHGYLVREFYTFNVTIPTRFDVWSCTKSFTGTAWGLLLDDSRRGRQPDGRRVDLDSAAYDFIPAGHPLSDPRKEYITVRHLLTMTSGIAGENSGIIASPTGTGYGPFEHALGRCPSRYGRQVDKLTAEPGSHWDYSDPAFMHLSLAFATAAGQEMSTYMSKRVFEPIGIESLTWDAQGGSGFIGPHTSPHTGVHISAREMARFGYLMLHSGEWEGQQIIPLWWMELATQTSQDLNPSYGYTWWVNTRGTLWPNLPRDAFALKGYASNKCYIIPSLDTVIVRLGYGPSTWNEQGFVGAIVAAILE